MADGTLTLGINLQDNAYRLRVGSDIYLPYMATMTPSVDDELTAYASLRDELEAHSMGKWVVIREQKLISLHDSFEAAAQEAVTRFGRGPYLIRQIGAPPIVLPASVMYRTA